MKICFLVPHTRPTGGIRRNYMLARKLREDFGHQTQIGFVKGALRDWITDEMDVRWCAQTMPIADIYVTYADAPNEELVEQLPGKKVLLLLNAREWEKDCLKLPFDGVMTTSDWLVEEAKEAGQSNVYKIGVGLESMFKPPKHPSPARNIGTLARESGIKRHQLTSDALRLVQEILQCNLNIITYSDCNVEGPSIHYAKPTRDMIPLIYQQCGIWLVGSEVEGFGMPGLEAMASGCALVTTDTKGSEEYARQRENCLIVNNTEEMAFAIIDLIRDDSLREKIAKNGVETSFQFNWTPVIQRADAFLRSVMDD